MPTFINTKGMNIEKWRKARENYLGASEISSAVGLNPYRSPLDLWREKSKDPSYKPFKGNNYTKWGSRLENSIAWGFSKDMKIKIRKDNKIRIHDNGILSASLDRLLIDKKGNGTLEIKNMSDKQFNKLVRDDNDVSMMYFSQVQQQFAISEFTWGYFVILVGGNTLITRKTKPDYDFIDLQSRMGVDFWKDNVLQKKPPEYGDRLKYKALKKLVYKSEQWKRFRFTPNFPEEEEIDPIKIFINKVEAVKTKAELNKLLIGQSSVIEAATRENKSLLYTLVKVKRHTLK